MKKVLAIVAFAALVASFSNAATAKWIVSGQYDPNNTAKLAAADTSAMLVLCYSSDGKQNFTVTQKGDYGNLTVSDEVSYSGKVLGAGGTGSTGKAQNTYGDGTYYYIALYNTKGDVSTGAFTHYAVSSTIAGDPNAVAPNTPVALKWTSNASWTPVPEPCTVALLALGLAAVGLKRKIV